MGDTGSLSLGGSLGAVGIITKHEIVLAITGGLFVLEALSVMVQVISFKLTGKRIFKMAGMGRLVEEIIECNHEKMELSYSAIETMAPIQHQSKLHHYARPIG